MIRMVQMSLRIDTKTRKNSEKNGMITLVFRYTKRCIREIKSIIYSDRIILNYPDTKSQKDLVNLHYFLPQENSLQKNLGDSLSRVIVQNMLEQRELSLNDKTNGKRDLYALGSIIVMGHQNATIWGSGLAVEPSKLRGAFHSAKRRRLDIRAVRGPLTRRSLHKLGHDCPEIYGDPAILMPLFYQPRAKEKSIKRLIIPHFSMEEKTILDSSSEEMLSMNTNDYRTVIDTICNAEIVLSSSLHGIILAEAYGVPAVFYQDRADCYNYKYEDYYLSTNRHMHVCAGLKEARRAEPMPLPSLERMQERLIDAFPYDLWKG